MSIPTICYLEAFDKTTNEFIDKLHIGVCNYHTEKITLKKLFKSKQNEPKMPTESAQYIPMQNYMKLFTHVDDIYLSKIQNIIDSYEPETMDEDNALYDMKLVLYWTNQMREEYKNKQLGFVFIQYYAVLENVEYDI